MKSPITKNQHYRALLASCQANGVKYRYVLNDTWYTNAENMTFVVEDMKRHFVMAAKENMFVMICDKDDKIRWRGKISELELKEGQVRKVYITGVDFTVYISKHVFKNEDGTTGTLYLCSDDQALTADEMLKVYQKRWPIEEFHKSLKQNASLSKSPTSAPACQIKHILCSFYGYIKLEKMKLVSKENHFAMRMKLYISALRASFAELDRLREDALKFKISSA